MIASVHNLRLIKPHSIWTNTLQAQQVSDHLEAMLLGNTSCERHGKSRLEEKSISTTKDLPPH